MSSSFSSSSSWFSSSSNTADSPEEPSCPTDESNDDCGCPPCDTSDKPIRFFNGEVVLSERDLIGPVAGFGHGRSYSNKLDNNYAGPNGNNWLMPGWPYFAQETPPPGKDDTVVFVRGQERVWFDKSGTTYTARNAQEVTYKLIESGSQLVLEKRTSAGVETCKFHNFGALTHHKGMLVERLDAYGNKTEAFYNDNADRWIAELRYTVGNEAEAYSVLYDYYPVGEHTDRIKTATMRKTDDVNAGTIAWSDIRRVAYGYYGAGEAHGNQNDLKLVTVQKPDPQNAGAWLDVSKSYYRYYLASDTANNGFVGALKYVVSPIAWAEMQSLDPPINPEVASTSTMDTYADHYFEYDENRCVDKEVARNCSGCGGGGGTGSAGESFVRTENAGLGPDPGYNEWKWKVVLTKANNNIETVYTNYLGQVLLKELKESSTVNNLWYWVTRYGETAGVDAGKVVKTASPAAFDSFSESQNGLNISLKTDAGLVTYRTYYGASPGAGGVTGYLDKVEIREGDGAMGRIPQRHLKYTTQGDVVRVSEETVYKNTDGTGAITTSYAYQWYTGSTPASVQQVTTSLPDTGSQNGTNNSQTKRYYDENGRMTFSQDARGIVTKNTYNQVTGRMTRSQVDVPQAEAGMPSGWTVGGETPHLDQTTDYAYDDLGRQTRVLGPKHDADTGGANAVEVRHATWTVYVEGVLSDQTWVGRGYQATSGGADTLINPVAITFADKNGRPTDQLQAQRTSGSGALGDGDQFNRAGWSRWTFSAYDPVGRMIHQRSYHDIPAQQPDQGLAGIGANPGSEGAGGGLGGNYVETDYAYDNNTNLRVKTLSPDKTITRTVYDAINRPIGSWVGTDDTGATATDPTGGGAGGNNMEQVSESVYDNDADGGDSFLTKTVLDVDGNASNERATAYTYDFRGRRLTVDGEVDLFLKNTYDNLGRVTKTQRYDTTEAAANLVGEQETDYDDRNRVYETRVYEVDPTNGDRGTHLTGQTHHDANGNATKSIAPGSGAAWTQNTYDNLGRATRSYTGYDDTSATDDEVVVQDGVTVYNNANQATRVESKQLNTGSGLTSQTYRTSYMAMLYDGVGRAIGQANYGIDAPSSWPGTVPARSDTVLVTTTAYDPNSGDPTTATDPGGIVTTRVFDDMGRLTKQVDNDVAGTPSGDDQDRTTEYTYTADSQRRTVTAVMNPTTDNQVTTYTYGVTAAPTGSSISANNLLREIQYPTDTATGITLSYNRQAQVTKRADQNGTLHDYAYDKLGRPITDAADTLGTGIDGAVRRLTTTYNNRGLPELLTSWSTTSGTSGVVNQVRLDYNDFGQLTSDWQEHTGEVDTAAGSGQSLRVQYAYAPGIVSATPTNQIRPTSMTYPDGRQIDYGYGASGSIDANLNRVASIDENSPSATIASYDYLGLGTKVVADYEEADVRWEAWDATNGYTGLDAFGRVSQCKWAKYGSGAGDLVGFDYGYNRNSLPAYLLNNTDTDYSELYGRDGLDRLDDHKRGALSSNNTAIASPNLEEAWGLDEVANWKTYYEEGGPRPAGQPSTAYDSTRTHDESNEITDISDPNWGWVDPAYDAAGNTTTLPTGNSPLRSFDAKYDAWNRLVEADFGDGVRQDYAYDARGRRLTDSAYDSGLESVRHFYYTSGWQCVEERYDDTSTTRLDRQYVWGLRYVDDLVQRKRDTTGDGTLNETLYALNDRQFNVVALADTGGTVVQRMLTTPYGQVQFVTDTYTSSTNTKDWRHLFQGLRQDTRTFLYENRNRVLHPLLGRFLQRDPLGYPDGMNSYAAYHVMKGGVDPSGLDSIGPDGGRDDWWPGPDGTSRQVFEWNLSIPQEECPEGKFEAYGLTIIWSINNTKHNLSTSGSYDVTLKNGHAINPIHVMLGGGPGRDWGLNMDRYLEHLGLDNQGQLTEEQRRGFREFSQERSRLALLERDAVGSVGLFSYFIIKYCLCEDLEWQDELPRDAVQSRGGGEHLTETQDPPRLSVGNDYAPRSRSKWVLDNPPPNVDSIAGETSGGFYFDFSGNQPVGPVITGN